MNLYRIQNINCPLDSDEYYIRGRVARELGVRPEFLVDMHIERRSIDARDKRDIRLVYTVVSGLESPSRSLGSKAKAISPTKPYSFPFLAPRSGMKEGRRPIIVGAGPSGLFCALMLAESGFRPIVIERGDDVDTRGKAISSFWTGGELDPESNMQFGEGGAGTYSDGKLTSSGKDDHGRTGKVLATLIDLGAPGSILYDSKPHIGTDNLVVMIKNLRARIRELGGEIRFRTCLQRPIFRDGMVSGVELVGGEHIDTDTVVLAIGHSARDTFAELAASGVPMECKSFAMGLRVEHPQEMISRAQYGDHWNHPALGVADYKLTHQTADRRGVYSFCMCPGGYVVDASSEPGLSSCNGMSHFARSTANANSAIVVAVRPDDWGGDKRSPTGVLAGVEFQRIWEHAAWEAARASLGVGAGHSAMPVQTLGDFVKGVASPCLGAIIPSIRGAYGLADLNTCVPDFVASNLKEAFVAFDRIIPGFARSDAVLTGIESRTSSPVRITRGADMQSSMVGLYPCGEGAGYAGGIMSAASDGIRVAEALAARLLG